MIKVESDIWGIKEYTRRSESLECELAIASYLDDFSEVKRIVETNSTILDVNAIVYHSPTRGNGTALILTGSKEIAKFLLDNGANINRIYDTGIEKITALDSALRELEKSSTKSSSSKAQDTEELIFFLKSNGAKKFKELNYEK